MWEREPMVGLLESRLDRLGIRGILYDLDDTILTTTEFFDWHKSEFMEWVVRKTGLEYEIVSGVFREEGSRTYDLYHVNPNRWVMTVREMGRRLLGNEEALMDGLPLLMKIYSESPGMIAGIRPILDLFRQCCPRVGIVTHANEAWTQIKMDKHGLWNYIDILMVADENGPKTAEHWSRGGEMLGVSPNEVLVFGDNVKADVLASMSVGMRAIAIKPVFDKASGYLPNSVPVIHSLVEAPEKILLF